MIWLYFGEQQGHYLQKMSLRMDHVLDLPRPPKHTPSSPTFSAAGTAEVAADILEGLCQHIGGLFRTIQKSFPTWVRISPRIKGGIRNSLSDQPTTSTCTAHSTFLQNLLIWTSALEGGQKVEPTHEVAGLYPLTLWVILHLSLGGHSHSCRCSQSSVPQTSLPYVNPSLMTTTEQNAELSILKPHEEKESHCTRL